ncbi:MAG TPA: hypothetical protein VF455_11245, partial [Chryseobacterium sp.]
MTVIQKIEQNEFFKFFKENFSLLILLSSLLGGLRQFLVLFYYSPTLIQYFSFSQIAIDGLETIIQGIYVLLFSIIFYIVLLKDKKFENLYLLIMVCLTVLFFWMIFYKKDSFLFDYKLTSIKSYTLKFTMLTITALMFAYS